MAFVCFECGLAAQENHHVVPKSLGGTKTIPLCCSCHGKVHGVERISAGHLISTALKKYYALGKAKCGYKPKYKKRIVNLIAKLKGEKIAVAEIARRLNMPRTTVRDILIRSINDKSSAQN